MGISVPAVNSFAAADIERLRDLFQGEVTVWRKDETWSPLDHPANATATAHRICSLLCERALKSSPVIDSLNETTSRIAVQLDSTVNIPTIAIVQTNLSREQLLEQLLATSEANQLASVEAELREQQLELYASQVSADFEELACLRELVSQVERCTIEIGLEGLATSMLPMLGELLHCGSITLVLRNRPGSASHDSDFTIHTWGADVDQAVCSEIIQTHRERAGQQPVILNRRSLTTDLRQLPGSIQNAMLVPITKDQLTYGWVLALEKRYTEDVRHHLNDHMHPDAFHEFGSSEASLLQSSATLLATHAKNLEMYGEQQDLLTGVVKALVNSLDARDPYTCGHSDRVARYGRIVAARIGLSYDECEQIYLAGLVHDIGKVGIPDNILQKPGRLTDEEFAVVKTHPEVGYQILKHLKAFSYVLPGVLHHHEAWDGLGYPHQLKGEDIPLMARILAVADTFDALTSNRPYRDGMPIDKAVKILREGSGSQWDANCIDAFLDSLAEILVVLSESDKHKQETLGFIDPNSPRLEEVDSVEAAVKRTSRS